MKLQPTRNENSLGKKWGMPFLGFWVLRPHIWHEYAMQPTNREVIQVPDRLIGELFVVSCFTHPIRIDKDPQAPEMINPLELTV